MFKLAATTCIAAVALTTACTAFVDFSNLEARGSDAGTGGAGAGGVIGSGGTIGSGGSSGSGGVIGSGWRIGSGGAFGSGGALGTGGAAGAGGALGAGGAAPTCVASACPGCIPVGPFGCCKDAGTCGCTWAPGAICY